MTDESMVYPKPLLDEALLPPDGFVGLKPRSCRRCKWYVSNIGSDGDGLTPAPIIGYCVRPEGPVFTHTSYASPLHYGCRRWRKAEGVY